MSTSKRPFVVVTGDFVRTGGQDYANFALVDYLSRQGHDVHLVAYRADDMLTARPNVTLHRVPKPLNAYTLGAPLLTSAGLAQYALRRRDNVIGLGNGGNCPLPSVNWVHYCHAAYRSESAVVSQRVRHAVRHPLNLLNERAALRVAECIVVNSERTKRDVIEKVGARAAKVHTVYYGIDPDRFAPATTEQRKRAAAAFGWALDRFRVTFIGALGDRRKGFDRVFEAWSSLCATPEWDGELVVVGSGAEAAAWEKKAKEAGIERFFRFLGFRKDVPVVLAASDALVSATRYEAYGLGVHEALCSGLAAIVSRDAGVAERYPRELEWLLIDDPENAKAIADTLRQLRSSTERTRTEVLRLSASLRARTWDDMASDIEKLALQT